MSSRFNSAHPAQHSRSSVVDWLTNLMADAIPTPRAGCLQIVLPTGSTVERAGSDPGPTVTMHFRRWRGLGRILLSGDRGFAESYLDGEWTTGDLPGLLAFFVANEDALGSRARNGRLVNFWHRIQHVSRENTRSGSRRNISAHYDLGNAFYELWLDGGMNYSSAIYAGDMSLEAAQAAKLDRVIELLDVAGSSSVLEIGCGWGALAERLATRCSAFVGVTLSKSQIAYAQRRLDGLTDGGRCEIRLQDYRDIDGRFDRIASIEMLEAVGERYWPIYFDKLRALLAPGGIAVLQVITIAESRFEGYRAHPDFIQRHIFPGGMLPTVSRIEAEARRTGLVLETRQDFGESYARTLAEWRHRFASGCDKIKPLGFDDRFRRMWEYYLAYCEAGFRNGLVDVSLFRLRG